MKGAKNHVDLASLHFKLTARHRDTCSSKAQVDLEDHQHGDKENVDCIRSFVLAEAVACAQILTAFPRLTPCHFETDQHDDGKYEEEDPDAGISLRYDPVFVQLGSAACPRIGGVQSQEHLVGDLCISLVSLDA